MSTHAKSNRRRISGSTHLVDAMVWRHTGRGEAGTTLVVQLGEAAAIVEHGTVAALFPPGRHPLPDAIGDAALELLFVRTHGSTVRGLSTSVTHLVDVRDRRASIAHLEAELVVETASPELLCVSAAREGAGAAERLERLVHDVAAEELTQLLATRVITDRWPVASLPAYAGVLAAEALPFCNERLEATGLRLAALQRLSIRVESARASRFPPSGIRATELFRRPPNDAPVHPMEAFLQV